MRAHHVVIPVLRNQRRPMSNMRDVNIAFACTALTYLLIGILFAVFFPNAPFCTQQVFLDNFSFDNLAVFNIRVMLAIQFIARFPLRAYLLRVRTLQNVLGFTHISQPAIFIFNCITTLAWILISQHAARPADFIRYVGATTGLVTQIILPLACQLMFLRQNLLLSYRTMAGYGLLVLAGVAVLAGQFTGV
ncbi:neutral amino acid transporter 9-like [Sycon ciliatum]|uniref:neutral amino acid transporter 9-like n=1 Tax=Sycon ciliatum TaxID=27933 RepID=UPI0031F67407